MPDCIIISIFAWFIVLYFYCYLVFYSLLVGGFLLRIFAVFLKYNVFNNLYLVLFYVYG